MRICFTLKFYWQKSSGWLQLVFFHFGSENWEEQVKNNPVYYISSCRVFRDREVEVQFFLCPLQTKLTSPDKQYWKYWQRFSDFFVFSIFQCLYTSKIVSRRHHLFWYFSGGDSSLPSPWKYWPWQFWFWNALLTIHQRLLVRNHMGQIILWWFTFFFKHRRKFIQCIFFPWRSCLLSSFKSSVVNLRVAISAASLTSSSPNSALATLRL